jgi:hypothetical protein
MANCPVTVPNLAKIVARLVCKTETKSELHKKQLYKAEAMLVRHSEYVRICEKKDAQLKQCIFVISNLRHLFSLQLGLVTSQIHRVQSLQQDAIGFDELAVVQIDVQTL